MFVSILSISYGDFGLTAKYNRDPLHIFDFSVAQFGISVIILCPTYSNLFNFVVPSGELDAQQTQCSTSLDFLLVDGDEIT